MYVHMNSHVWIAWIMLDCTSAHMLGHNFHFTGCFDIKLRWLSELPNTYEKRCLEVDSSIRSVCWYMWTLKVLLSSIIALFTCMYDMISHLPSKQSAAVFLFISFKTRLAAFDCGNCVIVFICCNNLGKALCTWCPVMESFWDFLFSVIWKHELLLP